MFYCTHCQTITGTLDARPEWYSPPQYRCSRCGNMIEREEPSSDGDDDRLSEGFELMAMSEE